MEQKQKPSLFLCGGLQSSGSTFLSWCFLQRQDMNGFFDANNDILTDIPFNVGTPHTWYKTTLSCFRLTELITYYEEAGWNVTPLLVIRDCRHVWNSLVKKKYGRDGTTAEDPPLRMRFRRFKEDWNFFREKNWPIIRFESFTKNPEESLKEACLKLGINWDDSMLSWPKPAEEIQDVRHGNKTFKINRTKGLTIDKGREKSLVRNTLPGDLTWLESEFKDFNQVNNYPLHDDRFVKNVDVNERSLPCFSKTRRKNWKLRHKPFKWLITSFTNYAKNF